MGELHLEIIVDRLMREFGVPVNVGRPMVAYRETITQAARAEGKFVRQSGGQGQYGHVILEVEPSSPGEKFQFVDAIKGGTIPREYIPAVEKGVREAAESGVLAGYPVVDVKVTLRDGSFHEVDSSELAFKIAGSMGFKEGARRAKPVLLEPIMSVEVVVPEQFIGEVTGDLSSRRGKITNLEARNGLQVLEAKVPLAEMFGYATQLRSSTQGRATYTMQVSHYERRLRRIVGFPRLHDRIAMADPGRDAEQHRGLPPLRDLYRCEHEVIGLLRSPRLQHGDTGGTA